MLAIFLTTARPLRLLVKAACLNSLSVGVLASSLSDIKRLAYIATQNVPPLLKLCSRWCFCAFSRKVDKPLVDALPVESSISQRHVVAELGHWLEDSKIYMWIRQYCILVHMVNAR